MANLCKGYMGNLGSVFATSLLSFDKFEIISNLRNFFKVRFYVKNTV